MEHVDAHFSAMLVAERLDDSHRPLEVITGRTLRSIKHANVNRNRVLVDELDSRLVERIRDLNRLDQRLYDIAQERLIELL